MEIKARLEEDLVNAEHAVQCVLKEWEHKFLAMQDVRMRRRSTDVADLARRLLRKLVGIRGHSLELMPEGSVLVAPRLLPSEAVFLSRRSAKAVVVEVGGPASHCALLTRGMGIPAVARLSRLFDVIAPGETLIVDGNRGLVTIAPDQATLSSALREVQRYALLAERAKEAACAPAVTLDGARVAVMANVASREEAKLAAENGADGIGLYRIEAFYLGSNALPSEIEVRNELAGALSHFRGKPVCVRLLDVGGDKSLPYLRLPVEGNPFLGRRGVRLLLDYPELLHTQLRAMLALRQDYDLSVLVPMVTLAADLTGVREALESMADEEGIDPPPLGAMIETPAAVFSASKIAQYADFISVGTNDLAQYVLAADRGNPLVSRYYQDDHESVMSMLRMVVEQVQPKPVAVCGELASREPAIPRLLQAGVRILSAAAPLVPVVKETVRNANAVPRGPVMAMEP
jgi:phosphoenolpyruvate-protein phosphotransferase